MRLNCANCGAEYEVGDDAIPAGGREVQCSACGYRWHAEHQPDLPLPAPDAPDTNPAPASGQPTPEGFADDTLADVPRRPVDPAALAILREEAAREVRARNAEAGVLEFQPELGLEPVVRDAAIASASAPASDTVIGWAVPDRNEDPDYASIRSRAELLAADLNAPAMPVVARSFEDEGILPTAMSGPSAVTVADDGVSPVQAEIRPEAPSVARPLTAPAAQVREVAPRDSGPAPTKNSSDEAPPRSGFAKGFLIALLLSGLMAVLYLQADQLSQEAPAAAPYLHAYADAVERLRFWLDQQIGGLAGG